MAAKKTRKRKSTTKRRKRTRGKSMAPLKSTTKRRKRKSTTRKRRKGKSNAPAIRKRARKRIARGGLAARVANLEKNMTLVKHDLGVVHHATVNIVNVFRSANGTAPLRKLPGYRSNLGSSGPTASKMLGNRSYTPASRQLGAGR